MGCGYEFGCKTCRKAYNLGYGCYSTWLTARSLEEYDLTAYGSARNADDPKKLAKNQRIREVLAEHDGHDHFYVMDEVTHRHGKVLCMEAGYMGSECAVLAEDWGDWEYIDLEERDAKAAEAAG